MQLLNASGGVEGIHPLQAGMPDMPRLNENMTAFAGEAIKQQLQYLIFIGTRYKEVLRQACNGELLVELAQSDWSASWSLQP